MVKAVFNYPIYKDNPYQQLLYCGLDERYEAHHGGPDEALTTLKGDGGGIFHVHWEEALIRKSPTRGEAEALTDFFIDGLDRFAASGGRIVWTVHNGFPHEATHPEVFLSLRRAIMARAHRICVHTIASIKLLATQGDLRREKVFYLPHPSYHGIYHKRQEASPADDNGAILIFGKVRRYKAIDAFLEAFSASGMVAKGALAHVCGSPIGSESYGEELRQKFGDAPGVNLDFRRVPDEEASTLLQSASCIALPYDRLLSSGVLLAAMTCGAPVVAPDLPQVREVLPNRSHAFLFDPRSKGDIMTKIDALRSLSPDDRHALRIDMVNRAEDFHPQKISMRLGDLYDSLIQ